MLSNPDATSNKDIKASLVEAFSKLHGQDAVTAVAYVQGMASATEDIRGQVYEDGAERLGEFVEVISRKQRRLYEED